MYLLVDELVKHCDQQSTIIRQTCIILNHKCGRSEQTRGTKTFHWAAISTYIATFLEHHVRRNLGIVLYFLLQSVFVRTMSRPERKIRVDCIITSATFIEETQFLSIIVYLFFLFVCFILSFSIKILHVSSLLARAKNIGFLCVFTHGSVGFKFLTHFNSLNIYIDYSHVAISCWWFLR